MKPHVAAAAFLALMAGAAQAAPPSPAQIAIVFDRSSSMLPNADAACSGIKAMLQKALEERDEFAGLGVQFGATAAVSTHILVLGTSATGRAGAEIFNGPLPPAAVSRMESNPAVIRNVKAAKIAMMIGSIFEKCRAEARATQPQSPIYSATRFAVQWLAEKIHAGNGLLIIQSDLIETVEHGLAEATRTAKSGRPAGQPGVPTFDLLGKISVYSCGMANSTEKGMDQTAARESVQKLWKGLFQNPRGTPHFVDQCEGFGEVASR